MTVRVSIGLLAVGLSACATTPETTSETRAALVSALSTLDPVFGSSGTIASVYGGGGSIAPVDDYSRFVDAIEEGRAAHDAAARRRAQQMTSDWSIEQLAELVDFLDSDTGRAVRFAITDSLQVASRGVDVGIGGRRSLDLLSEPTSVGIVAFRELQRIREGFTEAGRHRFNSQSPIHIAILIGAIQLDVVSSVRLREFLDTKTGALWLEAREPEYEALHAEVLGPLGREWVEAGILDEVLRIDLDEESMILPKAERR